MFALRSELTFKLLPPRVFVNHYFPKQRAHKGAVSIELIMRTVFALIGAIPQSSAKRPFCPPVLIRKTLRSKCAYIKDFFVFRNLFACSGDTLTLNDSASKVTSSLRTCPIRDSLRSTSTRAVL